MLQQGKYEAKIIDYGVGTAKSGSPQVMILFGIQTQDSFHELTWYGNLSDKAMKYTLEALLACGMQGNDVAALADGVNSGLLDVDTPVSVTVAHEMSEKDGKTYARIKWVNRAGGAAFKNKLSKQEATIKLGALDLKAQMAFMRQELGVADAPRGNGKAQNFSDDIPF